MIHLPSTIVAAISKGVITKSTVSQMRQKHNFKTINLISDIKSLRAVARIVLVTQPGRHITASQNVFICGLFKITFNLGRGGGQVVRALLLLQQSEF